MTDVDALSARVTALETVLRQLMTHLAVHSDDPARWVATRRTLALHAVGEGAAPLEDAISGLFDQVAAVVADYAVRPAAVRKGTPRLPDR